MRNLFGFHFTPEYGLAAMTFEDSLEVFYRLLECSTIDIVTRKINDKFFSIICDDEALLRERPVVTALDENMNPMLCGKLLIVGAGTDEEGNLLSAEDTDYGLISPCEKVVYEYEGLDGKPQSHYALWPVSY